jgi:hypothetical protein
MLVFMYEEPSESYFAYIRIIQAGMQAEALRTR